MEYEHSYSLSVYCGVIIVLLSKLECLGDLPSPLGVSGDPCEPLDDETRYVAGP